MLRLAKNKGTKDIANYVLPVMEKLQYMYATHYIRVRDDNNYTLDEGKKIKQNTINEILRLEFSPTTPINDATFTKNGKFYHLNLYNLVKRIYESKDIENKVNIKFKKYIADTNNNYDTLVNIDIKVSEFNFDEHIIFFILFEMIINAKKNRWHCLDHAPQNRCDNCRNELEIVISNEKNEDGSFIENGNLNIKISSTGTPIQSRIIDKITQSIPVKTKNENEGLYLISSVLKDISGEAYNPISYKKREQYKENQACRYNCKLCYNIFTVTVKPIKNE
jgi:hypothetical protein